jgi:DNA polymerase I-like protein with 3'-5' exonuclease and polymerase domains
MPIAAVDFESYYDDEISITTLGIHHYLQKTDIYLVSIATDTGIKFVGHPKAFDWRQIEGPDWVWLAHNAGFDWPVFMRLQELGVGNTQSVTQIKDWYDTADLTAYLGLPRSLKSASIYLLGQEISKDVRDRMKGKQWETMTPEFRKEVEDYALKDAENCLQLWLQHGDKWPEHEREISRLTREMGFRGVPIDKEGLEKDINKLNDDLWELRTNIPWKDEPHRDAAKARKGEKMAILSPIAIREECLKVGITAPASFAKDDPEAEEFFETYADKYPWVRAVRDYRRATKHLATLKTMQARMRPDGWMPYSLKYFGAHTGRDSGDAGINLQNLPKGLVAGVDVRSKIMAPEGYTLAIVDLSQIEPRVIHWLADDETTLKFIREIPDLYEAFARSWGLYTDPRPLKEVDPKLRHATKTMALGLQYGMGSKKFADVAGIDIGEAIRLTNLYRKKNPKILALWKKLEKGMAETLKEDDRTFQMHLPSDRLMHYRNVTREGDKLSASISRQGKLMQQGFWGGVLTENLVQSTAREVFMYHCAEIENAGIPVLMRVHDEAVCLVPEELAQERLNQIIKIMSSNPSWAPGLPLAAEGSISKVYKK